MGLSTLVGIAVAILIGLGLRSIARDWRKKFEEDDKAAEVRKKAQQERNRQEAKRPDVVTLERGEDGVYRPGRKD
ncbi:hypothetical protein [Pelagibacterium xiamenense]|uniref:hypothetical protein n=1 Tax=Pelagibacterium xiamenense TaxID=2901140 RepID=UPI001E4BE7D4|nr:hypothetical protein [Pelagibacterium xiamenense]MCD7059283.1 hypothetical protein [Pelagibacterium xiamenense]